MGEHISQIVCPVHLHRINWTPNNNDFVFLQICSRRVIIHTAWGIHLGLHIHHMFIPFSVGEAVCFCFSRRNTFRWHQKFCSCISILLEWDVSHVWYGWDNNQVQQLGLYPIMPVACSKWRKSILLPALKEPRI